MDKFNLYNTYAIGLAIGFCWCLKENPAVRNFQDVDVDVDVDIDDAILDLCDCRINLNLHGKFLCQWAAQWLKFCRDLFILASLFCAYVRVKSGKWVGVSSIANYNVNGTNRP